MITSFAAFDLGPRVTAASGRARALWIAVGAAALGMGIWSVHHLAVLALGVPMPHSYHLPSMVMSLLAAVSASVIPLWVISRERMRLHEAVRGSVIMGVGIASMHYAGTASMRMVAPSIYQLAPVALFLCGAIAISWFVLWRGFQLRGAELPLLGPGKLGSAMLLGGAIPLLHYGSIAAGGFESSVSAADLPHNLGLPAPGAAVIVFSTLMVLALVIAAALIDRRYAAQATALQAATTHYQRFLRQVIDTNPHLIFVKDGEGKYVLANEAVAELYGTTVESLLGKTDADFNPKREEVEQYLRADREVMASQKPLFIPEEPATCARSGETRWFQTVKVPLLSPDGGTRQVLGVATDITQRKHLEDQFRQAHKMEAVGRLAGGVAHDFNNVLTIIRGQTEFLLADLPEGDARRADVLEIQQAADRAAVFTRQLLAFSRRQLLQPEVLQLNTVISGMEMMLRRLVGEDVVLLTKLHPDLPLICADPGQLQQVLLNLAVNSRDAMPRGGTLLVETAVVELDANYPRQHPSARTGTHVVLAVTDTGFGMDAATRARLFEPFFTTKEPGKGTGLGLSTVYGIVKQSGGHIWVYSEVDRGTTFKLYFPPHHGAVKASEPERPVVPTPGTGATILLVEDERQVRSTVRRLLERHGYTVMEASNGHDALALITAHGSDIDLVLSDMVMPGMGGTELASRVRALSPTLPVLLMTGYTEEAITRSGARPLEEQIIEKPFSLPTMLEKVRAALSSGQA